MATWKNLKSPAPILILLMLTAVASARIIYVDCDAGGAGNGTNWADAHNHLQDALAIAVFGDHIRVAEGIYKPDSDSSHLTGTGDRRATFQLITGVALHGGYAGISEPDPDARDIELYETILSGDLAGNDLDLNDPLDLVNDPNRAENSFTVVTGAGVDATAVLDGFTITAGHADNAGAEPNSPENNGAGMYNHPGSPTLRNCTFHRNSVRVIRSSVRAAGGAGVFNCNSSPTLHHCNFTENVVFTDELLSLGGGMFNLNSDPTITGCTFSGNWAHGFDSDYYGGGMCNYGSSPQLTDCSFIGNSANSAGGGIYNDKRSNLTLTDCSFRANWGHYKGGAMHNEKSTVTLNNCRICENVVTIYGGGIHNDRDTHITMNNCAVADNQAERGGGMYNYYGSSVVISNCTFKANTANSGGGIYDANGSNVTFTECTFRENAAGFGGGAMTNGGAGPELTGCTFIENSAVNTGGGLYNYGSASPTLTGCTFVGNSAGHSGGAMSGGSTGIRVIESTFVGNSAGHCGGALMGGHNLTVTNCVFIENSANDRNGEGGAIFRGEPNVTNCSFIANSADSGGALNCLYPAVTNCAFVANLGVFGGAVYTVNATVTNSTFTGNSASGDGGAMRCFSPTLTNSIFWNNQDSGGADESGQIHPYQGAPVINYCCVQGWTGSWGGTGNTGADPCFVQPGFWASDDVWVDGDYHLLPTSPGVDAGDNNSVPADTADLDADGNTSEPVPFDLDGNLRIADGDLDGCSVVDMGAYEYFVPPIELPMEFTPRAFNPYSAGKWVKAHFVLPEGFTVDDVDANTPARITEPLEPDLESEYIIVFANEEGFVEVEAAFSRAEFCAAAIDGNNIEVTVAGSLSTGQLFCGTDRIKITANYLKGLAVLASQWLQTDCGEPDWCTGFDLDRNSVVNFVDFTLFDGCCIQVIAD
ncbi:MAG: right-handed parallel beta-helix repeat-containing protein [Planctomycetota bacterium]|jgi:parallel beta-helix repeat protein/predicted outer membrane repeat protein